MSLLKRLNEKSLTTENNKVDANKATPVHQKSNRQEPSIYEKLHQYVMEELNENSEITDDQLEEAIPSIAEGFFETEGERLTFEAKQQLVDRVIDELTGYGPITTLLKDKDVSEIMVNGPKQIYVEKKGQIVQSPMQFRDDDHVLQVIEKIVSPLGRRIDESSPMVDARLEDGSRVNAIIPPLSLVGPSITIRKFPESRLNIDDLIRFGTLSEQMAKFLDGCVKARLNVFISGGTGSGKTTLLNVLSNFIQLDERIVTIEDAAELQLGQDHVVSLETRPPNIEGKGEVTIRDLVKNSLRMRPDRVIIGEVRSAEALDMLQAMNTGHDGSLATGHANTPRDMIARLETMVLMAGIDLPLRAIRDQIAGAVDLIIQQSRLKDGSRKITHVTEVIGMEGDTIVLQDIFVFKQTSMGADGKIQGEFVSTGIRPYCAEKLERYGIHLPSEWFEGEG
ncbi:CpaF family protein [Texcoconibacillus texcoconensis]|uniref:Pilus assembly protein CpaF n=1 Tax=Texcoconibacillus texcoconensis TaxID=1095777 RepID=A0A840QPY2_9BACI|nr:CpaF family protein [Texcoconibacillus texcoconensis]MBB5173482.1 pilus assembly protein CpaF [Texcoconibacillus texcoconensis]